MFLLHMITTYSNSVVSGKLGTPISSLRLQSYEGPLVRHTISQLDIILQSRLALQPSPINNKSFIALHQSKTNISIQFFSCESIHDKVVMNIFHILVVVYMSIARLFYFIYIYNKYMQLYLYMYQRYADLCLIIDAKYLILDSVELT